MRLLIRPAGKYLNAQRGGLPIARGANPLLFRGAAAEPQRRGGSPRLPMVRGPKCVLGRKTGLEEFSHG